LRRFPQYRTELMAHIPVGSKYHESLRQRIQNGPPKLSGAEASVQTVGFDPACETLPPGRRMRLGKFELLEVLGTGSFGTVYKGRAPVRPRSRAVKVRRQGSLASPDQVDRFLREARSAAQLQHPSIVALHEAGQCDGTCYLVSEFIPGQTLAQRLAAERL